MSWTLENICNLPENYFQPMCNCINPPITISNVAENMLAPYYCWYAPCFTAGVLKTPEIIEGQLQCNIVNCTISIDQIQITGGTITIQNSCAQNLISITSKNVNISLQPIEFSVAFPIYDYTILLLVFGIGISFLASLL